MAIKWTYDPALVHAVEEAWRIFRNRYEVACEGFQTTVDGVHFELSDAQKTTLRADVVANWQTFINAVNALKAHAVG